MSIVTLSEPNTPASLCPVIDRLREKCNIIIHIGIRQGFSAVYEKLSDRPMSVQEGVINDYPYFNKAEQLAEILEELGDIEDKPREEQIEKGLKAASIINKIEFSLHSVLNFEILPKFHDDTEILYKKHLGSVKIPNYNAEVDGFFAQYNRVNRLQDQTKDLNKNIGTSHLANLDIGANNWSVDSLIHSWENRETENERDDDEESRADTNEREDSEEDWDTNTLADSDLGKLNLADYGMNLINYHFFQYDPLYFHKLGFFVCFYYPAYSGLFMNEHYYTTLNTSYSHIVREFHYHHTCYELLRLPGYTDPNNDAKFILLAEGFSILDAIKHPENQVELLRSEQDIKRQLGLDDEFLGVPGFFDDFMQFFIEEMIVPIIEREFGADVESSIYNQLEVLYLGLYEPRAAPDFP